MWWRFWTWGRKDVRQPEFGDHRRSPSIQSKAVAPDSPDSEDILGSISSLIGDLPPTSIDSDRKVRSVSPLESVQATETVETFLKVEPAMPSATEAVPVADSISPGTAPTPINTPHTSKPVREKAPSKRNESRKDGRQTLVAGEGKWMDLKGMFDGSKDQNDTDDDDGTPGQSPYQTIVPSDD